MIVGPDGKPFPKPKCNVCEEPPTQSTMQFFICMKCLGLPMSDEPQPRRSLTVTGIDTENGVITLSGCDD